MHKTAITCLAWFNFLYVLDWPLLTTGFNFEHSILLRSIWSDHRVKISWIRPLWWQILVHLWIQQVSSLFGIFDKAVFERMCIKRLEVKSESFCNRFLLTFRLQYICGYCTCFWKIIIWLLWYRIFPLCLKRQLGFKAVSFRLRFLSYNILI